MPRAPAAWPRRPRQRNRLTRIPTAPGALGGLSKANSYWAFAFYCYCVVNRAAWGVSLSVVYACLACWALYSQFIVAFSAVACGKCLRGGHPSARAQFVGADNEFNLVQASVAVTPGSCRSGRCVVSTPSGSVPTLPPRCVALYGVYVTFNSVQAALVASCSWSASGGRAMWLAGAAVHTVLGRMCMGFSLRAGHCLYVMRRVRCGVAAEVLWGGTLLSPYCCRAGAHSLQLGAHVLRITAVQVSFTAIGRAFTPDVIACISVRCERTFSYQSAWSGSYTSLYIVRTYVFSRISLEWLLHVFIYCGMLQRL